MKENEMTASTQEFESPSVSEIRKALDAKIPGNAVAEREGGGGRTLSYLEGWYVIDRLNKVLGQGNWGYDMTYERLFDTSSDGKFEAAYIAKVSLWARFPNQASRYENTTFEDVGYGDGKDRNRGKAHESAIKEAVTDGIKRCAKNLGMSMGLALYDKKQENVDDADTQGASAAAPAKANGKGTKKESPVAGAQQAPVPEAPPETRETLNQLITEMANVLTKQRKTTVGDLKKYMSTTFNAAKKEDLNDGQAKEFYGYLRGLFGGN
jgi:DNA recombination protein Rad52